MLIIFLEPQPIWNLFFTHAKLHYSFKLILAGLAFCIKGFGLIFFHIPQIWPIV